MKADEGLMATPIMAVTAYAAKGDEERIRDAGAEGYVSKPISVLKFVEAVARPARRRRGASGGGRGGRAPDPEGAATEAGEGRGRPRRRKSGRGRRPLDVIPRKSGSMPTASGQAQNGGQVDPESSPGSNSADGAT